MPRYSGIVQSVEQRTVKLGATRKKVLKKPQKSAVFFNICSLHIGINFWKKVSVFYAIYGYLLPLFCKKLYIDIRKSQTYVFAYLIFIFFVQSYDE